MRAAYAYDGYFKVTSVVLVTALHDSKSKRRKDEDRGKQQTFAKMLSDERKRQSTEADFEGRTIGYAQNGQLYVGQTVQRVYN